MFGGTNDSWSGAPLGELTFGEIAEAELFRVLPAISHFAKRLTESLPDTKVVFIANCGIKSEIIDAMRAAAAHYGCGYIALADIDKVNGHPTETGMAQICEQVLAGLRG